MSHYIDKLDYISSNRYKEKLNLIRSECPYGLSEDLWAVGVHICKHMPNIIAADVFIYLAKSRSDANPEVTKEAYKGLSEETKRCVADGWVKNVMCLPLSSCILLLKAKVRLKYYSIYHEIQC